MSLGRIGIPDGSAPTVGRNMNCPGALLRVDRESFRELAAHGHPWASKADDLPPFGRGDARTFCRFEVAIIKREHGVYAMGLCSKCSEMESNQRKDFAERGKRQREEERRGR